ncbi:DUF6765 family protein [Photobacterium sp. TY1-4]|uniref:DUF6765 family protein n=1 Tax=Photobacterium sp. TY1-4 TaxID=2899122 RepID=UPI0021C0D9CB|nr:DUF6765 family protein [Photobacterium sp. TY1-4]UXI04661.1 hypothetical protein NH461_25435 [Photobacterium sp. TY1-4]
MQIDMHYYGTYCLARAAGLKREAARTIATAAQFVDDNAQQQGIELEDASCCRVEPTAHHTTDFENIDRESQRHVWVPFHFLPGNEGRLFTERLVCRKDSSIAREMCHNHLTQTGKPYFLPLLGIMSHVYADTFAHYGFSGVSSRWNRVVNDSFEFQGVDDEIKAYIVDKKNSFFARFNPIVRNIKSHLAEECSGALGHGGVVTFPDRPYLRWRFEYESHGNSGWRDNTETFLEYAEKIHQLFTQVAQENRDWSEPGQAQSWSVLAPKVRSILQVQGKKEARIRSWQQAVALGDFLNQAEEIPDYQNWNDGFDELAYQSSEQALSHPIYQFYQAASYHRWYVLRELLPAHGLMVI